MCQDRAEKGQHPEAGRQLGGLGSCLGPGERAQQPTCFFTEGPPDLMAGRVPDPQPQLREHGLPSTSPLAFALSQPLGVWKDILGIWKICKSI